jgi:anti-sigma regulatory factor (Ser/Thr protein kinase)
LPQTTVTSPLNRTNEICVGDDMLEADPAFGRDPVHMTWPAEPHLLSHLRSVVRAWSLGLGFSPDTTEDIVLAANEAASNTIDHAYPDADDANTVELRLWVADFAAHVEVLDHGRWQAPKHGPALRGFGLRIMRQLIDTATIHPGPAGTTVLLLHPLPRATPV